jgi:hypothetical protein
MACSLQKAGALCGLEALGGMVNVAGMKYVGFDDYIPAIEGMYDKRCLGVMVGKAEWIQIVSIPPNDYDHLDLYGAGFRGCPRSMPRAVFGTAICIISLLTLLRG